MTVEQWVEREKAFDKRFQKCMEKLRECPYERSPSTSSSLFDDYWKRSKEFGEFLDMMYKKRENNHIKERKDLLDDIIEILDKKRRKNI